MILSPASSWTLSLFESCLSLSILQDMTWQKVPVLYSFYQLKFRYLPTYCAVLITISTHLPCYLYLQFRYPIHIEKSQVQTQGSKRALFFSPVPDLSP